MNTAFFRGTARALPIQEQINLLKRVRKIIQEEPRRLNMSTWGLKRRNDWGLDSLIDWPACGTVACIAGWIILGAEGEHAAAWDNFLEKSFNHGLTAPTYNKYRGRVSEVAAELIGMQVDDTPFLAIDWTPADVDSWLEMQIKNREALVAS